MVVTRGASRFGCALLSLALACGEAATVLDDAGAPPIPLAEPPPDFWAPFAEPLEIELGTGTERFEPLEEGTTLTLERGSQGLQHVYVSVRGLAPPGFRRVAIAISVDPRPVEPWLVEPFVIRAPWSASPEAEARSEVVGLVVVVEAPDALIAASQAHLHVRVQDGEERGGWASQRVRVAWPD